MKILTVITARGGSKSVPGKNIRLLGNKPLIGYTIESAKATKDLFYKIIVSTDDRAIADVSKSFGAEVPFIRPSNLAEDKTPTLPVLQHAVNFIEDQDKVLIDWVLLLQPTAPFRSAKDIRRVVELSQQLDADSIISVVQVFSTHPGLMKKIENNELKSFFGEEIEGTPRQQLKPSAYMRNGAIYMTKRDVLMKNNSIWGKKITPYIMPLERSYNIDDEIDFKTAEVIINDEEKNQ